jgi:hypothetical protein
MASMLHVIIFYCENISECLLEILYVSFKDSDMMLNVQYNFLGSIYKTMAEINLTLGDPPQHLLPWQ